MPHTWMESQMWTLHFKIMLTVFWSKGITFLKDTEYKTLMTFDCVCLFLFIIPNACMRAHTHTHWFNCNPEKPLLYIHCYFCHWCTLLLSPHAKVLTIFHAFTVGVSWTIIFLVMTLCRIISMLQSLWEMCCLHSQGDLISFRCMPHWLHPS